MNSVIKLKDKAPRPGTVDLRKDNRIGDLLDEYEYAVRRYKDIKKERDDLSAELKAKLGDAKSALVDGWILRRTSYKVKEHVVKAFIADRLFVERHPRLQTEYAKRDNVSHGDEEE